MPHLPYYTNYVMMELLLESTICANKFLYE